MRTTSTGDQQPRKRAAALAVVVAVVGLWGAASVIRAPALVHTWRDDPKARCAEEAPERKAELRSVRWTWFPAGWECQYATGGGAPVRVP